MKKSQKSKTYWLKLVQRHKDGESIYMLAKKEKLGRNTVKKYLEKYSEEPLELQTGPRKGMKRGKISKMGYYQEPEVPTLQELMEEDKLPTFFSYEVMKGEESQIRSTKVDKIESKEEEKPKRRIIKI